jgi:hypothetical protein
MGNWFLLKNNLMPVDDSIFDYNRNVLFVKEVELRAILFKYTWERGECHLFQTPPPPPPNRRKKIHTPPPEFTSESIRLQPEKKIIKIISFTETPRASN